MGSSGIGAFDVGTKEGTTERDGSFDIGNGDLDVWATEVGEFDIADGDGIMEGALVAGELVTKLIVGKVVDIGDGILWVSVGESDFTGDDDEGAAVRGIFEPSAVGMWVGTSETIGRGAIEYTVGNEDDGFSVDGVIENGVLDTGDRDTEKLVGKSVGSTEEIGAFAFGVLEIGVLVDGAKEGVANTIGTSETGKLVVGRNTVGTSERGAPEVGISEKVGTVGVGNGEDGADGSSVIG